MTQPTTLSGTPADSGCGWTGQNDERAIQDIKLEDHHRRILTLGTAIQIPSDGAGWDNKILLDTQIGFSIYGDGEYGSAIGRST